MKNELCFRISMKVFQTVGTVVMTWFKLCTSSLDINVDFSRIFLYFFFLCLWSVGWTRVTPEGPPPMFHYSHSRMPRCICTTNWLNLLLCSPAAFLPLLLLCNAFDVSFLPPLFGFSSFSPTVICISFCFSFLPHSLCPAWFLSLLPSHSLCISFSILLALYLTFCLPVASPCSEAEEHSQRGDCPGRHQVGGGSWVCGGGGQTSSHHQVADVTRWKPLNQHHKRPRRDGNSTQLVSPGPNTSG